MAAICEGSALARSEAFFNCSGVSSPRHRPTLAFELVGQRPGIAIPPRHRLGVGVSQGGYGLLRQAHPSPDSRACSTIRAAASAVDHP